MIGRLLHPWRGGTLWPALVHGLLDLPVGIAGFVPVFVLLAVSAALLITFPLALPVVWALFACARLVGRVDRSRFAALHGAVIPDPVPPLPPGSWWARLKARARSVPRWKEIAYALARFPLGVAAFVVLAVLWSGSAALVALPAVVGAFPDDTAHFGLFDVTLGPGALLAAIVGVAGLVVVAPWATIAVGRLDVAFARWLLGPSGGSELAERATRAETGRKAAVQTAETERRRIERDLHDGAQQRLVALAIDLGTARERLETDPERGRQLVADAHEEAKAALREIRDLVRGIHPVILEDRGLDAALSAIVARSPVPVELRIDLDRRLDPAVESAAYFVVAEALTNVARHARATQAHVAIARTSDHLIVEVRDDGIGGADPAGGTGLAGLRDRAAALGGTLTAPSPAGGPTTILVELPCGS